MTREEAVEIIKREIEPVSDIFPEVREALDMAVKALEEQPKTGEWIEVTNSHRECPYCHTKWSYVENEVEFFDHCPRCGAKME